jgi:citrate lyase subunit beta / citryl-CoA lyase
VRSSLYVPADRLDRVEKALGSGADAIIIDLEDAVAPSAKPGALAGLVGWLEARPLGIGSTRSDICVRINAGAAGEADLLAILPAASGRVHTFVVPKVEGPNDIAKLGGLLTMAEQAGGLADRSLQLIPLVETARGVLNATSIAVAPRVLRLAIGEADLASELGIDPSDDERELWTYRSLLVVASAAALLPPPIGPISADFRDLQRLRASSEELRRMGFRGRSCIHPAQVSVVNDVFSPKPAEVDRARLVVAAYDRALAEGHGVVVDADGRMIDEAIVRASRRVLDEAESLG